jgi:hypothetical protein
MSPYAWLQPLRVERAKTLIGSSQRTLADIEPGLSAVRGCRARGVAALVSALTARAGPVVQFVSRAFMKREAIFERMGAQITKVPASHAVYMAQAQVVAGVIERAAREAGALLCRGS